MSYSFIKRKKKTSIGDLQRLPPPPLTPNWVSDLLRKEGFSDISGFPPLTVISQKIDGEKSISGGQAAIGIRFPHFSLPTRFFLLSVFLSKRKRLIR